MGCCGQARWKREEVPDHKFDFIDVRDYWSNGYLTRLRYALLYVNIVKSIAVYIADIYTAITLLAFHKFNGNIYNRVVNSDANTVKVPFNYGRWIFTGCIIFSFLLLLYEAHKARAVIRSRDISYAYTNVMANDYYSLRSYNHFCFFCQINNSKKKKDELAFFIFFTFKGWKRLLVADGPRQVINALTLFALAETSNFSTNIVDYYEGNIFTLVMLLTMVFTVLVFAGSAILLLVAALMYLPLVCYIQGNLKEYCCHKIDKRISELVQKKKKQRLGKYAAIARAEAAGDFKHLMNKKGEIVRQKMIQPTLPNLGVDLMDEDPKMIKRNLDRNGSISSSTAHGTFYGMETKEGAEEYGSTAHLLHNQPTVASTLGHQYGSGSMSSTTLNGNVSLPPTVHNSPDTYPMKVYGSQGVQEVLRSQGGVNNPAILSQMGPIGSTPEVFAHRMVGRAGTLASAKGGDSDEGSSNISPSPGMDAFRMQGRAKSPLMNGETRFDGGLHNSQATVREGNQYMYSNIGVDYPPPKQAQGVEGLEYPPPPPTDSYHRQQHVEAPSDLSAYAPYHPQDEGARHLGNYPEGHESQRQSRAHSFSDVYEAYYQEDDGAYDDGRYSEQQQQQSGTYHGCQQQQHYAPSNGHQAWRQEYGQAMQQQEQYETQEQHAQYTNGYQLTDYPAAGQYRTDEYNGGMNGSYPGADPSQEYQHHIYQQQGNPAPSTQDARMYDYYQPR